MRLFFKKLLPEWKDILAFGQIIRHLNKILHGPPSVALCLTHIWYSDPCTFWTIGRGTLADFLYLNLFPIRLILRLFLVHCPMLTPSLVACPKDSFVRSKLKVICFLYLQISKVFSGNILHWLPSISPLRLCTVCKNNHPSGKTSAARWLSGQFHVPIGYSWDLTLGL